MRTTEILCTVYATCSLRGVNFLLVRKGTILTARLQRFQCRPSLHVQRQHSEQKHSKPCRYIQKSIRIRRTAAMSRPDDGSGCGSDPEKHGRFVPKSSFQSPSCYHNFRTLHRRPARGANSSFFIKFASKCKIWIMRCWILVFMYKAQRGAKMPKLRSGRGAGLVCLLSRNNPDMLRQSD